jgi:hypothetical protein
MSLILLASVSGAPGVTTTALNLALSWPRRAMVVEADLSRPSSILPGMYRGQLDHSRGITPLAIAHQRGSLQVKDLWAQTTQFAKDRYVLPGFATAAAAAGSTAAFWGQFGQALAGAEGAGTDVIVDAGRIGVADPRLPLLQQADLVVVLTRPLLPDLAAIASRTEELTAALEAVGHAERLRAVLVESEFRIYTDKEIATVMKLPILATLPWHPRTAAVVSLGESPSKATSHSTLTRETAFLANAMIQAIHGDKTKLGTPIGAGGAQS